MHVPRQSVRRLSVLAALTISMVVAGRAPALRAQAPVQLPPQAAAVELDGDLEVQVEDSATGARLLHFLHVNNRRLRLQFSDLPPRLVSGTRVHVRGRLDNDTLALSAAGGGIQVLSLAAPNTFGDQRTAVILVNFQDNTSMPYSPASASAITFQSTSDFYRETSYNQASLSGDVFGWYTLPMASTSCDTDLIASLAEQAVAASGRSLSGYTRRIYGFPSIGACSWWGLGTIGGNPSRAWVNGSYALQVVGHELGHNFGVYHSHSAPCDTAGCGSIEYGDDHDIMGNLSTGHFNAYQKERLGWLNYGVSPPIQRVSASGSYSVDAMEFDGELPKALKLLKSIDSGGNQTWYYVEFRTQAGADSGVAPGVLIHSGADANGNTSYEIDLDGSTSAFDALLNVGQTFTDAAAGLSITTTSAGAVNATVDITYAGASCTTRAPAVSFSPSGTLTTSPGQTVQYTMTIRNQDDAACAPVDFTLGASVPVGWGAGFDRPSLRLAPGAASTALFSVVTAADASGPATVVATAARTSTSGPAGSVSGTVMVMTGISVSFSAAASGNSEKLNASVTSGGAAVSGANVTFSVKDPKGGSTTFTATTSSAGVAATTMRLKPKDPKGTYQVQVSAVSGALLGTTSGTFVR